MSQCLSETNVENGQASPVIGVTEEALQCQISSALTSGTQSLIICPPVPGLSESLQRCGDDSAMIEIPAYAWKKHIREILERAVSNGIKEVAIIGHSDPRYLADAGEDGQTGASSTVTTKSSRSVFQGVVNNQRQLAKAKTRFAALIEQINQTDELNSVSTSADFRIDYLFYIESGNYFLRYLAGPGQYVSLV